MNDIALLTATEMSRCYRDKVLTPLDVVQAVYTRIDALNAVLTAYVALDREAALRAAAQATEELSRRDAEDLPLLHGIPVSIKDVTAVKGLPLTHGSPLHRDQVAAEDALIVQRLRDAGAIVIGKSNTPDFAFGGNTTNALFGPTRNPWNLEMTPGGSSGGGAVAVATGMGPIAHGTDLGGSLRTPASFCGIAGFRTTPGLVPIWPNLLPWDSYGVEGTMARSIQDLALSLAAIAGPDERAPLSYPVDAGSFMRAVADPDVRGWRVAWSPDLGGLLPVDPEIVAAVERASSIFARLGANVRQDAPDFSDLLEAVLPSRGLLMVAHHAERYEKHLDQLPASLAWNVKLGLGLASTEIAHAEIVRGKLRTRVREFFNSYDILLMPTEPVLPFPIDQDFPAEINGVKLDNPIHWFALCYAATVAGVPALSIPAGFSKRELPIGVAILGGSRREDKVLRAAAAYEQAQPWLQFVPPVVDALHSRKPSIP